MGEAARAVMAGAVAKETTCSCQNHEWEYIEMIPIATTYRLVVLSTLNKVLYLYSSKKTMGAAAKAVMAGERLKPDALARTKIGEK